eukprot:TRINITY_DN116_c0_g1_i1.p1 TRINITY_DN116_c0_g1~~TRINITY_DN116_c0_g1_i1.p1  ORF type:complete len:1020 (+),score=129.37 TRINITY_DN116_c0_g1_i1:978-4037(+)
MSSYFQNARTSEVSELQDDLNSLKHDVKREAVKQVIATMTYGKDMSMLFPHVVKCMETTSIELKKLVYLYIINYARSKADMTIMAINTFRKDAHEPTSPLLRALAVRTMGCIRIERITEYLCESLKDALADVDPYVRKTAAMCVAKLFMTNPRIVKDNGFIRILQDLLADGNANVVSNAIAALLEISGLTGKNYIRFNSSSIKKLLYALNECTEWGQIYILEGIAKYRPVDSSDAETIIEQVIPRLSHVNPAVVLAAVKVVLRLLDSVASAESARKTTKRLAAPLVTLLSNTSEIQYVVLRNISFIVEKRKNIFEQPKVFFVRHTDPIFVKLEKLDILSKIANEKNYEVVLAELREYANWLELEFTRKAIKIIGQIGVRIEKATKRALELTLDILKVGGDYVVEESTTTLSEILRHYPSVATESFIKEAIEKIRGVIEPESRAGYAWILGEYNEEIPNASELITELAEGCLEEPPAVQLQILLCAVKYYVTTEEDNADSFIIKLLKQVGEESENPDIRDQAYIYWRLLSTDAQHAADVLYQEKPIHVPEEEIISIYDDEFVDFLVNNMATTVSVYHKSMHEFIPEHLMIKKIELSDDDGENEEEKPKKEEGKKKRHKKKKQPESDHEEEVKTKKSPPKHTIKEPEDLVDIPAGNQKKGGFDLLDFGDIGGGSDLTISSADIEFLSGGGKGYIVDAFSEGQAGEKGTKGMTISGAFIRIGGVVKLNLVVINNSRTDLKDIAFSFAKNSFGLAPKSWNYTEVPRSSKKSIEIFCILSPDNLDAQAPPPCPFKVKVRLSSSADAFTFDLPCMLHVLLSEGGTASKETFKKLWQSLDKSLEYPLEIPTLKSTCQTAESLMQVLESFNIGITTKVKKQDSGQVMLYCSCQTVNSLPIVMELAVPSGKPGVAARVLVKVPVPPIGPLALESLRFILLEPASAPFIIPQSFTQFHYSIVYSTFIIIQQNDNSINNNNNNIFPQIDGRISWKIRKLLFRKSTRNRTVFQGKTSNRRICPICSEIYKT